jgi:hypothetical protein
MEFYTSEWKLFVRGFYKVGFWFLVLFIIGVLCGMNLRQEQLKSKLDESVVLGAFVLENKVYDVKLRP